jgi:hypothetical protein
MALLLAFASLPFATPVTATDGRAAQAHRARQVAMAFREKLGFRADPAFVDATFGNPRFSASAWGVPLDIEEAAELHRRVGVQVSLGRALRAAAADPDSAGVYFDEQAGHVPVFLTSRDPARMRRALAGVLPGGVASRIQRVRYSTKELEALQERINLDLRAGILRDRGITSTAIDTRSNAVVVGSSVVTDELRRALVAEYGAGLVLALEPESEGGDAAVSCDSRTKCPPAKGGLEIHTTYNGNYCTTGPLVRVANSSALRILTGGHCLGLSGGTGTSKKWTHNGTVIGWSEFYSWADGADADVALINPNTNPVTGDRNLMYRSSNTDIVGMKTWKPTAEQVQGSLVCRSAAISGYVCGTIALINKTKDVDGHSIDHQWVVDFDACPGDSGAPYLLDKVVWGIHSDSTSGCNPSTNQAWYSPMGWVFSVLASRGHPVELCGDPTCASSANSWAVRGSLNGDVWNPRIVKLLDGRVLQVGGEGGDPLWESAPAGPARAAQIFDPATGAWSDTAPPPWLPNQCTGQFAVRLSNGSVLVGGGASTAGGDGDPCAGTAYVFDPSVGPDGSWTTVASMPQTILSAGASLLNDGRAFVTGGTGASGSASIALAYAPTMDKWTTLTPAPEAGIAPLVLGLHDGRVLVSGGYTITDLSGPQYADSKSTYVYNATNDTWSTTTSVGARGMAGLVLADGRVAVAGGQHLGWDGSQNYTFSTTVRVMNPATGAWTQLAPLRTGRANFTLVQLANGQLLAAAGLVASTGAASGAPSKTADVYDWATNAWYPAQSLQEARADQGSIVLGNQTVLTAGGGTASSETYTPGDVTPPATGIPLTSIASATTMGTSTVPARISWTSTDAGGSGLGTYDVARSTDGGAYATLASVLTSASYTTSLTIGHTYRFQVRSRDNAGNLGPWKAGPTVTAGITQQTSAAVTYTGAWSTGSTTKYSGGTVRYATGSGASATYRFTGRSIAFVTTRATRSGSAKVYVDGVLAATVNLYASSFTYRYVAFAKTWTTSASHRITVVVVGTSGHPRIDIDAFLVLRDP